MPAKGSVLYYGDRNPIFNKKFFKEKLKNKPGLGLTYKECKAIIEAQNQTIADFILNEEDGFKLPQGLGHLVAIKFLPTTGTKLAINWPETKKLGKYVYFTNLHTDGYSCRVMWYRAGGETRNRYLNEVFKFRPCRDLARAVSKAFKEGKFYVDWTVDSFRQKTQLTNLYNKKFRKEYRN